MEVRGEGGEERRGEEQGEGREGEGREEGEGLGGETRWRAKVVMGREGE